MSFYFVNEATEALNSLMEYFDWSAASGGEYSDGLRTYQMQELSREDFITSMDGNPIEYAQEHPSPRQASSDFLALLNDSQYSNDGFVSEVGETLYDPFCIKPSDTVTPPPSDIPLSPVEVHSEVVSPQPQDTVLKAEPETPEPFLKVENEGDPLLEPAAESPRLERSLSPPSTRRHKRPMPVKDETDDGDFSPTNTMRPRKKRVVSNQEECARWPCTYNNCYMTFSRQTDVRRHLDTVHDERTSDEIYREKDNRLRKYCRWCYKILARSDARMRHEKQTCRYNPQSRRRLKATKTRKN